MISVNQSSICCGHHSFGIVYESFWLKCLWISVVVWVHVHASCAVYDGTTFGKPVAIYHHCCCFFSLEWMAS